MSTNNRIARKPVMGSIFDNLFERSISDIVGTDYTHQSPAVNISECDESFRLDVAVPGLTKQDFNVTLEKDQLTIAVDTTKDAEETTPTYTRKEYSYTKFSRKFALPKSVDRDSVRAQYELGLLTVTVDKTPEAKSAGPRSIEIR